MVRREHSAALLGWLIVLSGCDEGPMIHARPQSVSFAAVGVPAPNQVTLTVSATATSGLPVNYSSLSPTVCAVDAGSGTVTATVSGVCSIAADQPGNDEYAPAPRATVDVPFSITDALVFAEAPSLSTYDRATVVAVSGTGEPVAYTTTTPDICSVDGLTGLVNAWSEGACEIIGATPSSEARVTIVIAAPRGLTVPGAPAQVAATSAESMNTVFVTVGATAAGGSPLLSYQVESNPPGASASAAASPITVHCPGTCRGRAFSVTATNAQGTSAPSVSTNILTSYDVTATFHEPDTRPNDTLFVGTFTFDATIAEVFSLQGKLSESMTGSAAVYPNDTMTWLSLTHQLVSVTLAAGGAQGLEVATFFLRDTQTLCADPGFGGTNGWEPGSGSGLYSGYPGENPGNAYVLLYIDTDDPTANLGPQQLDVLAYADCTRGGMMGATCMTGTSAARYGTVGTMSGYPVQQVVTVHRAAAATTNP